MDPTTAIAVAAIIIAAASEIIALSPLKENSVIQVLLEVAKKILAVFSGK